MKKIIIIAFCIISLFSAIFLTIHTTHAFEIGAGNFKINLGEPDVPFKSGEAGVDKAISTLVNAIITISTIAFIILFLVGGIMYLTTMGSEEQSGKAKKLLVDAVIGLVIVLAAWAISTWIINQLKGSSDSNSNTPSTPSSTTTGLPNPPMPTNSGSPTASPSPIEAPDNPGSFPPIS